MENAIVIKQTATNFANKELAKATRLIVDDTIEIDSAAVMFLTAKDALDGLCEIFKDRVLICDRLMNIKRYIEDVETHINETEEN